MSKILITGTSYVQGAAATEIFIHWQTLVRRLNPGIDVLVIDSASPTPLPAEQWGASFDCIPLPDNIGHLSRGGRDGWGRAFTTGLQAAVDGDYEWVVNIECDMLFARPVEEVLAKMIRHGVRAAAPMAIPYQFTETALSFWSVDYLREIDLIGKYNWREPPAKGLMPEMRIDAICAGALFALPLRGMRNDLGMTAAQLARMFPAGIDWITHCELPVARKFMEMSGG